MARIININAKSVKNLAAATAAMCITMGLNAQDTKAAQAALADIAQEEGAQSAKAIIVSMEPGFRGFYA